jgi:FkbH-like protein
MSHPVVQDLRNQLADCLSAGQWAGARTALEQLWRTQPTLSTAGYVANSYRELREHVPLRPCRLAVLRSFTLEPMIPVLNAAALVAGFDLTVHLSPFNAYAQEILSPGSPLYSFDPEIAVLAVQTRDIAPALWDHWTQTPAAACAEAVEHALDSFRSWIRAFRANSSAHLLIHNLEQPVAPAFGMLDSQREQGQAAAVFTFNRELRRLAAAVPGVYVLDYDALVARHGRGTWHDERKWLTARMPIAASNLQYLAEEWVRALHPLLGKVAKVLVTDLDNTLWSGVIGEDGIEGIKLGADYPGACHLALQRALLDLSERGILLAACSKNNPEDALAVLERHPEMLLRPRHFATMRLNWTAKAENLRDIARELNLGTESLAFLDDNPVERDHVRTELPEVTVLDWPDDPLAYAQSVRRAPVFERLALSAEDGARNRYYAEQRKRDEMARQAGSIEDFYRSLGQRVEVMPAANGNVLRVAQLTQKTNQFNLTTHRYSEQQIAGLSASPDCRVYAVRVTDRFGDNGIVGAVITRDNGEVCDVDTLVLSCRVIGRTVETAILSFLVEDCRARNLRELRGWFRPTAKNAPAADFYRQHNFQTILSEDGATLWSLPVAEAAVVCPEWIAFEYREELSSRECAAS